MLCGRVQSCVSQCRGSWWVPPFPFSFIYSTNVAYRLNNSQTSCQAVEMSQWAEQRKEALTKLAGDSSEVNKYLVICSSLWWRTPKAGSGDTGKWHPGELSSGGLYLWHLVLLVTLSTVLSMARYFLSLVTGTITHEKRSPEMLSDLPDVT